MSQLCIDIYFDLICPWCLIGKRNLESALETLSVIHPEVHPQLRWQPVQLLPGLPVDGVPFAEFYAQRLGSDEAVRLRQMQVRDAAARAGVDIAFERIAVMPNTARAHCLLATAEQCGGTAQHSELLERLFRGYFQNGENIGDPAVLLRIAREIGLDIEHLDLTETGAAPQQITQGVPYFVFDKSIAIAGAMNADTLLTLMLDAVGSSCEFDVEDSPT